jgi:hypothetical protein
MVVYYAHTMISYDSTVEAVDISLLERLGFEVMNPNRKQYQDGVKAYIDAFGKERAMQYFINLINTCDALAFRSLPNGTILSGVAKEIEEAQEMGIPIIELPCNLKNRMLDYPDTKEYLREIGHYKVKK